METVLLLVDGTVTIGVNGGSGVRYDPLPGSGRFDGFIADGPALAQFVRSLR